jgi:predicted enzyme related to lactoylglutathione lyase
MGRPVVHWEFWSEDPGKIAEFYEQVFGWEIRSIPDRDYRLVETGAEPGIKGGIMKPKAGPWPGKLAFYIDVDDIDDYNQRIQLAGGKIVVPKTNMPGIGELSLFEDPDGRVLGIWKQQR